MVADSEITPLGLAKKQPQMLHRVQYDSGFVGCVVWRNLRSFVPARSADRGAFSILTSRGYSLFAALRYVWNATRGHRLAPWRSEYLRWRVETYSGQRAETLTASSMLRFMWTSRRELLRFLVWTGQLKREAEADRE